MRSYGFTIGINDQTPSALQRLEQNFEKLKSKAYSITEKISDSFSNFGKGAISPINSLRQKLQELESKREVEVSLKGIADINRQIKNTQKELDKLQNLKSIGFKADVDSFEMPPSLGMGTAVLAGGALLGGAVAGFRELINTSNNLIQTQGQLQQTLGVTGEELSKITSKSDALSKVFGADTNEMSLGVSALTNAFAGLSKTEAFDLIEKGFLSGANAGGEFLSKLQEYPIQMKEAGLSAKETIALMSLEPKLGVFSDKGLDSIKEAGLRLREMSSATSKALNNLFKVSAQNGGNLIDFTDFQNQLKTGEISTIEATKKISQALKFVDKQTSQTVFADVFGGAGEDAMGFVKSLEKINLNLDEQINKSNPLVKRQLKQIELQEKLSEEAQSFAPVFAKIEETGSMFFSTLHLKSFQFINENQALFEGFSNFIINTLIPNAESFFDKMISGGIWIKENWSSIEPILMGIGSGLMFGVTALGLYKIAVFGASIATSAFEVVMALLNGTMMMNPIGLVVGGIAILIGSLVWAYNEFEGFRKIVDEVWQSLTKMFGVLMELPNLIKQTFQGEMGEIFGVEVKPIPKIPLQKQVGGQMLQTDNNLPSFDLNAPSFVKRPVPSPFADKKVPEVPDKTKTNSFFSKDKSLFTSEKGSEQAQDQFSKKGVETIVGGGEKTLNITINISKFQDSINITNVNNDQTADGLADLIESKILEVINGVQAKITQ